MAIIALTTDFGYKDPFVGIMKGVIGGINPQAQVVDLTHGIPPQDVVAGALVLRHSFGYFPPGTIHVAVVDPGVGSARRPLLIKAGGNYFIGPDNGLLSLAVNQQPERIIELSNPKYHLHPASATFHGRDIFAPVAAHLSLGADPISFGPPIDSHVRLNWPVAVPSQHGIEGEIVYIDIFGNLFTNIEEKDLHGLEKKRCAVSVGDITIRGLAPNYSAGGKDRCIALINSWGLLEIAVCQGSAQQRVQARMGDKVRISVSQPDGGPR